MKYVRLSQKVESTVQVYHSFEPVSTSICCFVVVVVVVIVVFVIAYLACLSCYGFELP